MPDEDLRRRSLEIYGLPLIPVYNLVFLVGLKLSKTPPVYYYAS